MEHLLYITNARIPTEKAHGLQMIKMCEAFQAQGVAVELIVPFRSQSQAMKQVQDLWQHYDVSTPFRIRRLWTPDFIPLEKFLPARLLRWLYALQCLLFALIAVLVTLKHPAQTCYSRDIYTIVVLCLTKRLHRKRIVFEAHELHGATEGEGRRVRVMRWLLRQVDGMVVITRQLQKLYAQMGIPDHKILMAPDGIDRKRLAAPVEQGEARRRLQISLDRKVVCYTGHLFQWKGVYTLAESSRYLPEEYAIYIVGGMEADIVNLQQFIAERQLHNIILTGYVPYAEAPVYLGAADVLVLPNSAALSISREYTSPLKLFEYMGARRPIVASDLPSIREILQHNENAYLAPPDDPKALAEGILRVTQDRAFAERLMAVAYNDVQKYTWDIRARHISTFFNETAHG